MHKSDGLYSLTVRSLGEHSDEPNWLLANMISCRDQTTGGCDCEIRLEGELLNLCRSAYENELDLVDIYAVVHETNKTDEAQEPGSGSDPPILIRRRNSYSISIRKLSVLFLLLVALLPFTHFMVCHLANSNPLLKAYPNLSGQRCLISLHATILEMVRPPANCSALCGNSIENFLTKPPQSPVIELMSKPSKEEFEAIAYTSRPIIVRNSNPSLLPYFNFLMLKDIFESKPGGVESVSEDCQFLPFRTSFASLSDVFRRIMAHDENVGPDSWYIGWSNCHPGVAAKLRAIFPRPDFLPEDSGPSIIDWIFVGSSGSGAAMHIDYVKRPSWQLQLSGIKTWTLKPPPECESECFDPITFTSHAGDYVFLETNLWYHQTRIEGPDLSISIGSEYD